MDQVMGIVYCAITTANIAIGYGKHAYVLDQATVEQASFLNSLSFLFGIISFSVPKLAVGAMLIRILNPNTMHKTIIWGLTGLGAVISGICIVILFTMCDPPEALWKTSLVMAGKATCRDVWILVNYAMFTGGMYPVPRVYDSILVLTEQRTLPSSTSTLQSIRRPYS